MGTYAMRILRRPIFFQSVKESFSQPAFLLTIIIEASLLILLLFGISMESRQGILTSLNFFGKVFTETELIVWKKEITVNLFSLVTSILTFLFILISSDMPLKNIHDPLLPVICTRPVTRAAYYFSNSLGLIAAVASDLILFSVLLSSILFIKGCGWNMMLIYASMSFCFEFILTASAASALSISTGSSSASVMLTSTLYYFISPLISMYDASPDQLIRYVAFIIPNYSEISAQTKRLFLEGNAAHLPFFKGTIYICFSHILCLKIFNQRDI
jgi:hypothetical protein